MKLPKSPITNSNNVSLVKDVEVKWIVDNYKKELGIDIAKYFTKLKKIQICKCLDTDYSFYYPFNLSGDSAFYEELQKNQWYYMDWKWEHEYVKNILSHHYSLLEIGCGNGSFLSKINSIVSDAEGLELNEKAIEQCRRKGIKVSPNSIQDYSKKHQNRYDVICSFQVLEHIVSVGNFLHSSLECLKKDGLLILSVPNNETFFLKDTLRILNMPPHHMGLWNMHAFISLQNYYPMILVDLLSEPLQHYHFGYAHDLVDRTINIQIDRDFKWFAKYVKPKVKGYLDIGFSKLNRSITGHSILAVYKKK
jgi:SAM-dependent methyltransferase